MSQTLEQRAAEQKTSEVARTPFGILKATVREYTDDSASRLSAALAYHTIFAVAPLLVIAVAVAGAVLGQTSTREQLVREVLSYTGSPQIAEVVGNVLVQTSDPGRSTLATLLSVVVLLIGASNLFSELKKSLNEIWDMPPRTSGGIKHMLISRLLSVLMVIATGIVLIATLLFSTAFSLPWC